MNFELFHMDIIILTFFGPRYHVPSTGLAYNNELTYIAVTVIELVCLVEMDYENEVDPTFARADHVDK